MCMFVFIDADSWNLIMGDSLRWRKKELYESLLRKESAIKIVTNSFPKRYSSSFKYTKRTEVSWEVHSLYVFRSQQDKKNFRSATLVLLYRSNLATSFPGFSSTRPLSLRRARRREPWERDFKLSISRQNGYAKQNIILLHFLANKPRRELSGIRKKEKPFTPRVLSVRMQNRAQQDKA